MTAPSYRAAAQIRGIAFPQLPWRRDDQAARQISSP
jgi:hypothetical protein